MSKFSNLNEDKFFLTEKELKDRIKRYESFLLFEMGCLLTEEKNHYLNRIKIYREELNVRRKK